MYVAKDEEAYLEEWIDYHLGIGFDRIFLYASSEKFDLQDWQRSRGIYGDKIHIEHVPGNNQLFFYDRCIQEHTQGYYWTAFFDVDEFLVLKKHDHVVDLLSEHCTTGSLQFNWYVFRIREKHLQVYEPLPVTKRLQYRFEENLQTKIIARTQDFSKMKNNTCQHDTSGNYHQSYADSRSSTNPHRPMDVAPLHHYRYKSKKEFWYRACIRKNRGKDKCVEDLSLVVNATKTFDDSAWSLLKQNILICFFNTNKHPVLSTRFIPAPRKFELICKRITKS